MTKTRCMIKKDLRGQGPGLHLCASMGLAQIRSEGEGRVAVSLAQC